MRFHCCRTGREDPGGGQIIACSEPSDWLQSRYAQHEDRRDPGIGSARHRVPTSGSRTTGAIAHGAAEARGVRPEQVVRSLLLGVEERSFVLVLMPGPSQVDWAKLGAYLGLSSFTTTRAKEVEQVTGYPAGAVSPFGLECSIRILVDPRIKDHEQVSLGAGVKGAGLILSSHALLAALEPELVDLRADSSS